MATRPLLGRFELDKSPNLNMVSYLAAFAGITRHMTWQVDEIAKEF